jgi:hypothetical protein
MLLQVIFVSQEMPLAVYRDILAQLCADAAEVPTYSSDIGRIHTRNQTLSKTGSTLENFNRGSRGLVWQTSRERRYNIVSAIQWCPQSTVESIYSDVFPQIQISMTKLHDNVRVVLLRRHPHGVIKGQFKSPLVRAIGNILE